MKTGIILNSVTKIMKKEKKYKKNKNHKVKNRTINLKWKKNNNNKQINNNNNK